MVGGYWETPPENSPDKSPFILRGVSVVTGKLDPFHCLSKALDDDEG